jgi:hypothetical protein
MCVPSDNIRMTRLCATKAGRIFMAGEDGYLYEFDYKPQESWFARRCRKVCHPPSKLSYFLSLYDDPVVDLAVDESRNMLYQLTAMHNLRVSHAQLYLGERSVINIVVTGGIPWTGWKAVDKCCTMYKYTKEGSELESQFQIV